MLQGMVNLSKISGTRGAGGSPPDCVLPGGEILAGGYV
ncbi:hypothetical protein NSU_4518 [Novosphingobium pentaromativorans US6-1]|uniref:Uncharacterized protein n=1 Tax=Novosphingobium pentaromativorans US6-1 TaxID=1088721 RepID=G6EJJ7_9SPHN|nr:hypothetical protein NSU_4518 [Novosphingobium pentaromativorans US6-1]